MWRVWVRRGWCIGSLWGNRRERDQWGDLGVGGWIILGWISRRWDVGMLAARLLRLWVRIPPGAWMFGPCKCCILSRRGLCVGPITHPEKSYRERCVQSVWSRWPARGGHGPKSSQRATGEKHINIHIHLPWWIINNLPTFYSLTFFSFSFSLDRSHPVVLQHSIIN